MALDGTDNVGAGASDDEVEEEVQDEVGRPSAQNQTLYDLLANADVDSATAANDSLLDRLRSLLDAPETNRAQWFDGVLDASYAFRESQTYGLSAPSDGFTSSASGGGSVTHTAYGMELSAGTTSGDTARAGQYTSMAWKEYRLGVLEYNFLPKTTTPWTDDCNVGTIKPGAGVGQTGGGDMYVDLKNEQYVHGSNTLAFNSSIGSRTRITFVTDFRNGDTTVYRDGSKVGTMTGPDSWGDSLFVFALNSNGNGETIRVQRAEAVLLR